MCRRRGNQAAGTRRISFCVALGAREGTGCLCVCVYGVCGNREKGEKQECAYVFFHTFREIVNVHVTSTRDRGNMVMCTKCTYMMTEQWGKIGVCYMKRTSSVEAEETKEPVILNPMSDHQ